MAGKYIIIEGGEGAGKDTHIARMRQEFGDDAFVYTREPGGTRLGKELRGMLLHETHGAVSIPAEVFLFLADRAQHVEELIAPTLREGKHVVSNRAWLSFLAYQVHGRQMDKEWETLIKAGIDKIYKSVPADLVIVLDVPVRVGHSRLVHMGKALDVMERMGEENHERIRTAYLSIAETLPQARIIDASRPVEEVWEDVKKAVQSVL